MWTPFKKQLILHTVPQSLRHFMNKIHKPTQFLYSLSKNVIIHMLPFPILATGGGEHLGDSC